MVKDDADSNKDVYLYEDLGLSGEGKGKKPIRPWELNADDTFEPPEIVFVVSPIKKEKNEQKKHLWYALLLQRYVHKEI